MAKAVLDYLGNSSKHDSEVKTKKDFVKETGRYYGLDEVCKAAIQVSRDCICGINH